VSGSACPSNDEAELSESDKQKPYGVFVRLGVGEGERHGCALAPAGRRLYDKPLPDGEAARGQLLTGLAAQGRLRLVV